MINCLVAVERNQGIGFEGQMPWPRLAGDMKWFKDKTADNIVIMGRKTWDSIGQKKLPGRINIVISRQDIVGPDKSFADNGRALDFCKIFYPHKQIYIIGGSSIYKHYMDIIDRFYITEIDADYTCDTFFDLDYVQRIFKNVTEHKTFNEPVKYTIKEYNL